MQGGTWEDPPVFLLSKQTFLFPNRNFKLGGVQNCSPRSGDIPIDTPKLQ